MLKELSEHWNEFRRYPSGERFECYYKSRHDRKRSTTKKSILIGAGVLVMAAGVFFLAVPGPGLLVMLIGAGLIARESLFVSRIFDRIEPHARKIASWGKTKWRSLSLAVKILLIVMVAMLAAAAIYGAYIVLYK